MTKHAGDFTTSFLDLLLSALGGVALLMVLFAAIQSNNAQSNAVLPKGVLVFKINPGVHTEIWMNREIGIAIEDEEGNCVSTFSDESSLAELKVTWPSSPQRTLNVLVESEPSNELTVSLWLRSLAPQKEQTDLTYVKQIKQLRNASIKVDVYWLHQPTNITEISLGMTNGFFEKKPLAAR